MMMDASQSSLGFGKNNEAFYTSLVVTHMISTYLHYSCRGSALL